MGSGENREGQPAAATARGLRFLADPQAVRPSGTMARTE